MTTSAPPTWPPANRGTASLARNPASPSSTPASGDFTEPVDGRHVGDELRFSLKDWRQRAVLGRQSTTAREGGRVLGLAGEEPAAHGILSEHRVRLPVIFEDRNEHMVVRDEALGTGRELGEKSCRVEVFVERPPEGRNAREEVREAVRRHRVQLY